MLKDAATNVICGLQSCDHSCIIDLSFTHTGCTVLYFSVRAEPLSPLNTFALFLCYFRMSVFCYDFCLPQPLKHILYMCSFQQFPFSVIGVAEHFRNGDRIFQGPSEPPDKLPATSSDYWQVQIIYTLSMFCCIMGAVQFCVVASQNTTITIVLRIMDVFFLLSGFPPDWAAQMWL